MSDTQQDIKQQVGNLIRATRKAKGLTQRELGDRLGLTKNTVTEYEAGRQNLTIETLNKIFTALNEVVIIGLKA